MAKYLVTGGAGFIGSHLVEHLVGMGQQVRVLDNLSTGRIENIKEYFNDIEFLKGDLSDYSIASKAVAGIDYVLHQAAISSVPLSIKEPIAVNESIVTSTVNLLKAAVEAKSVKRVVQAISAAVYGDTERLPIAEETALNPLSPYAVAKLAQESYGNVFYNCYGLEVISLRYFNVFGPRQYKSSSYAGVIPIFLDAMLKGESPVIFGDGTISRDFVYVENIVKANLLACNCKWQEDAQVINIGSGKQISFNKLVDSLNSALKTDIKPIYRENRSGDIRHSLADISKARRLLEYEPVVDFDEGLDKLISWCKKEYSI